MKGYWALWEIRVPLKVLSTRVPYDFWDPNMGTLIYRTAHLGRLFLGFGFRVSGLGFRVQGSGFRV